MTLVYLDLETTGLNPDVHEVWEVAYAVGDGPVVSGTVLHSLQSADPKALEVGRYHERCLDQPRDITAALQLDAGLRLALVGATIVGANPAFDAAFLRARWGVAPWHYRLLDIESYAMPLLGYAKPQGLHQIYTDLYSHGWLIAAPDHTAAGDVSATRDCHQALQSMADVYPEEEAS